MPAYVSVPLDPALRETLSGKERNHVAHHNVAVLTTVDKITLDEILGKAELRSLIWKRLDDTHALVDSERIQLLIRRMKTAGHAPRFSETLPS